MANSISSSSVAQGSRRLRRGLVGAVLAVAGLATVVGVFWVAFSEVPSLAAIGLRLGIAFSTLISALGQAAVLIGLWLVWSAARPRRPSDPRGLVKKDRETI